MAAERPVTKIPHSPDLPYSQDSESGMKIVETLKKYAATNFPGFISESEIDPNYFSRKFMLDMAGMGLLGMDMPQENEEPSIVPLDQVAVVDQVSTDDQGSGLKIIVANSLTLRPLLRDGSVDQIKKYADNLASGNKISCFGLSTDTNGSDAKGTGLRTVRENGKWKVYGDKFWITSANVADYILATIQTDSIQPREKGMSAAWIPIRNEKGELLPGISVNIIPKEAQKTSQYCQVTFNGAEVSEDMIIGQLNEGWKVIEDTLNWSRILIAIQGAASVQGIYEQAYMYGLTRSQFRAETLHEHPDWANHLKHFKRTADISRLLTRKAAWHFQNHMPFNKWASLAKLVATYNGKMASADALVMFGAHGISKESGFFRRVMDAMLADTYEGTRHIQTKIIDEGLKEAFPQIESKWDRRAILLPLFHPAGANLIDVTSLPSPIELMQALESLNLDQYM